MLHCVIFLRITGKPPRSETPFTISSFAKTVPNPVHQLTSVSAKYVNLYCKSRRCCSSEEKAFHSLDEKTGILSSQTALIFAFPSFSKIEIKVEISSALSAFLLYQELNNWIKIHCVCL